jgi:hypothetical protein
VIIIRLQALSTNSRSMLQMFTLTAKHQARVIMQYSTIYRNFINNIHPRGEVEGSGSRSFPHSRHGLLRPIMLVI